MNNLINNKTNKNLTKFIEWLKSKNLSINTIKLYQSVIKNYLQKTLTTANLVQEFKRNLKTHEPTYLVLKREILKSYAKYQKLAIDWEKINKIIPNSQKKFFTTLSEQELEQLKKVKFEKKEDIWRRNNLILDLLFYTGIRVNELVNLKHCDYQNNSLKVLGKGNKVRYVFIPKFLISYFHLYQKDYLFTNIRGQKVTREYIGQLIKERTILAVIKKRITPHSFRRSFATLLNSKGCKLTTIQKLLGHTNLETTASYIHNSYEELYSDYSKLWINTSHHDYQR